MSRKILERDIEKAVCNYAKEKGLLVYKFTSPNRAAVPDRLFVLPGGKVFFIEFKATGKKPTPAQEREHKRLKDQGSQVFVVDDIERGHFVVDAMLWSKDA